MAATKDCNDQGSRRRFRRFMELALLLRRAIPGSGTTQVRSYVNQSQEFEHQTSDCFSQMTRLSRLLPASISSSNSNFLRKDRSHEYVDVEQLCRKMIQIPTGTTFEGCEALRSSVEYFELKAIESIPQNVSPCQSS